MHNRGPKVLGGFQRSQELQKIAQVFGDLKVPTSFWALRYMGSPEDVLSINFSHGHSMPNQSLFAVDSNVPMKIKDNTIHVKIEEEELLVSNSYKKK